MDAKKALNLLGLALRAGKLAHGEAAVLAAIRNKSAKYVLVGRDVSASSKKNFSNKCQYYEVDLSFDFSRDEISQAIGKQRTSVALLDQGFSKSMKKLIE